MWEWISQQGFERLRLRLKPRNKQFSAKPLPSCLQSDAPFKQLAKALISAEDSTLAYHYYHTAMLQIQIVEGCIDRTLMVTPARFDSPLHQRRGRCLCELLGLESECHGQQTAWLTGFLLCNLHKIIQ